MKLRSKAESNAFFDHAWLAFVEGIKVLDGEDTLPQASTCLYIVISDSS